MIIFKTIVSFLQDEEYREILITTSLVIALGSTAYHYLEGWSWLDSIYFSVITLTTIGYGDLAPVTDFGKIFTIFYVLIGLGMILSFIQILYNHFNKIKITNLPKLNKNKPPQNAS